VPRGLPLVAQTLPPEVPPGLPSSIIERRPDIREAEQNLIAANAEIGVAKAAFFPQISLTGSGGGSFGRSSTFSSLMSSQLGIWSYGAQVSQPIFTGGALRGNLHLAESQHQQALIAYRQAIQRAFGDVSDPLIGYQKLHQVRLRLEDSVADLQESVRLSNMRYKGGTTTYLEVLDGQRSLYSEELPDGNEDVFQVALPLLTDGTITPCEGAILRRIVTVTFRLVPVTLRFTSWKTSPS
jgi:outer membrane protein, multidrug efflux system